VRGREREREREVTENLVDDERSVCVSVRVWEAANFRRRTLEKEKSD